MIPKRVLKARKFNLLFERLTAEKCNAFLLENKMLYLLYILNAESMLVFKNLTPYLKFFRHTVLTLSELKTELSGALFN